MILIAATFFISSATGGSSSQGFEPTVSPTWWPCPESEPETYGLPAATLPIFIDRCWKSD
jgi:hypothetical protein